MAIQNTNAFADGHFQGVQIVAGYMKSRSPLIESVLRKPAAENRDEFDIMCGLALDWCGDFGMLCTKLVLKDFSCDRALPDLEQEWESVKSQRVLAFHKKQQEGNGKT